MTTWQYFRFLFRLERGRRNIFSAAYVAAREAFKPTEF